MAIAKLNNTLDIVLVSPSGEVLERRTGATALRNVPIVELFPDEPVCIIDWMTKGKAPTAELLNDLVEFEGQQYIGYYGWGSAVKRGQTIGLTRDILVECGLLKTAERAQKTGRMLLGQGLYGGLKGKLRVQVVKPGTVIGGHPVADGHSLIRRSLTKRGYSGLDKIQLGKARQSYSFWQRVPWSEDLQAELKPIIDATMVDAADPANWLYRKGAQWDERKALVDLDAEMVEHPYVAQALSRTSAEDFARAATTIDVPAVVRVAVPTTMPKATCVGKNVLVRYPVDSNGSMQAVNCHPSKSERERIEKLEVIQYTVAAKDVMANGCLGIVDDDLMPDGVDIVLCQDDIKMGSTRLGDREIDGVVTFNQWYAAGCAIGVNGAWAKKLMGLDFDGDLVFVYACRDLPVLFQTVSDLPPGDTPKLTKTRSLISKEDKRVAMIINSMKNLVGFASNVAATTFIVADRETLAHRLGYSSQAGLNSALNWFIKVGTDGYKTLVDLGKVNRQLCILQSNLRRLLGTSAPWTKWPNEWAFRRGVPEFYREGMDENQQASCIPVLCDGTIAQICKLTLPSMKAALEIRGIIKVKPLSSYRNWAFRVEKELLTQAHELQMEFNVRVSRVNWSDPEEITPFHLWWQGRVREWARSVGVSEKTAACALWREAHSSRSEDSSAASVFIGFPEEAKWVIAEKPGKRDSGVNTLLVGLNYVFDQEPNRLACEVAIREFEQVKNNKRVVRKIVCGNVQGKMDARQPYPADMLGMVDLQGEQPDVGCYQASITKAGRGMAWHCTLVAL